MNLEGSPESLYKVVAISGHLPFRDMFRNGKMFRRGKSIMFRNGKCSDMENESFSGVPIWQKACSVILKLVFKDLFNQKAHKVKTFF